MLNTLATVFGGIGLFLLGMVLMTDGLKALAGDALRGWLSRFTGNRLSAVATGAGLTALVQSSSATTLATIGFVSAGLLSFNNAIGVIIGANIGTTSTGWIVTLLGLKLSIGTVALPLIGVGALARLLGRQRIVQAGTALAGFGLIFVGIDVLQDGMADLSSRIDVSRYAVEGWGARLTLVAVGLIMTVVMQSSSAAVATTLTALSSGAISLDQAAALVIGQNVGTTVTAVIAAIGAQPPARRTAVVHIVFNVGTGAIAFLLLPLFTQLVDRLTETYLGDNPALSLAAFHTAFNLLGAMIFIPLIPQLARLAERLAPDRRTPLMRHLDNTLTTVPALALDAAGRTVDEAVVALVAYLQGALAGAVPVFPDDARAVLPATAQFLGRVPAVEPQRLGAWTAVIQRLEQAEVLADLLADPALQELLTCASLATQRADLADALTDYPRAVLATRVPAAAVRAGILDRTAGRHLSVTDAFRALAAQRTLEQLVVTLGKLRGDIDIEPTAVPSVRAATGGKTDAEAE